MQYIAIGNQYNWGSGKTQDEAVKNMKRQTSKKTTQYYVMEAGDTARVNEMGGIDYKTNDPYGKPKQVFSVGM